MPRIAKTVATLRFFGDSLDPSEITQLLGHEPTVCARKGDKWTTARGVEKVSPIGSWRLEVEDREPGDLDKQIDELLSGLSEDLKVWRDLTTRFRADVFCGLFLDEMNEGLPVSPQTLTALGARNLVLDLDIYGGNSEED